MVSNVAYGRTIYVKLETTSKSKDVQAAFKALLKNNSVETSGQYKDIFEESTFTAVVLGGDAKEHNKVVTKDFNEIRNIIKDNAELSLKNPAYPISYTSTFLKDNATAAVHNNTDYIETTTTEYSSAKMTLDHYGAYVAQFDVSWDDTFDQKGNEVLIKHGMVAEKTKRLITLQLSHSHKFKNIKNCSKRMYRSCMGMVENNY